MKTDETRLNHVMTHECWSCIVCPPEGSLHRSCWQH